MKQYLIWHRGNHWEIKDCLPIGMRLSKPNSNSDYLAVDVSHWDDSDIKEFSEAHEGDQLGQLEGLIEYQGKRVGA